MASNQGQLGASNTRRTQKDVPAQDYTHMHHRYYVVRPEPDKTCVPMIALDELPVEFRIKGMPSNVTAQQISDWDMARVGDEVKRRDLFEFDLDTSIYPAASQQLGNHAQLPRVPIMNTAASVKDGHQEPLVETDHEKENQTEKLTKKPEGLRKLSTTSKSNVIEKLDDLRAPQVPNDQTSQSLSQSQQEAQDLVNKVVEQNKWEKENDHSKTQNAMTPGFYGKKKYCTHWIRTGNCDYVQEGCRYLHVIPDYQTRLRIGIRDMPRWAKEDLPSPLEETHRRRAASSVHKESHKEPNKVSNTVSNKDLNKDLGKDSKRDSHKDAQKNWRRRGEKQTNVPNEVQQDPIVAAHLIPHPQGLDHSTKASVNGSQQAESRSLAAGPPPSIRGRPTTAQYSSSPHINPGQQHTFTQQHSPSVARTARNSLAHQQGRGFSASTAMPSHTIDNPNIYGNQSEMFSNASNSAFGNPFNGYDVNRPTSTYRSAYSPHSIGASSLGPGTMGAQSRFGDGFQERPIVPLQQPLVPGGPYPYGSGQNDRELLPYGQGLHSRAQTPSRSFSEASHVGTIGQGRPSSSAVDLDVPESPVPYHKRYFTKEGEAKYVVPSRYENAARAQAQGKTSVPEPAAPKPTTKPPRNHGKRHGKKGGRNAAAVSQDANDNLISLG